VGWAKIVLGVLLLVVGLGQWRGRRGRHGTPKWMSAIDRMGLGQALGLGFALSAVNPKNLLMAVTAGLTIGALHRAFGTRVAP
jgi:threonine/homoserine/homoserine lactone efflux protein